MDDQIGVSGIRRKIGQPVDRPQVDGLRADKDDRVDVGLESGEGVEEDSACLNVFE